MTDSLAAMRARVRLDSPTRAADNIGGAVIAWVSQGEVWAVVVTAGGGQSADFDAAPSLTTHTLTINRRTDVRAGWRVVWGVRTFRIIAVRDQGGARIELVCEEEIR